MRTAPKRIAALCAGGGAKGIFEDQLDRGAANANARVGVGTAAGTAICRQGGPEQGILL